MALSSHLFSGKTEPLKASSVISGIPGWPDLTAGNRVACGLRFWPHLLSTACAKGSILRRFVPWLLDFPRKQGWSVFPLQLWVPCCSPESHLKVLNRLGYWRHCLSHPCEPQSRSAHAQYSQKGHKPSGLDYFLVRVED